MSIKAALAALRDEAVEFVEEPSMDELSDVMYCINRLAGAIVRKPYIKLVPGTRLHVEKVEARMKAHGCIRSKRHLVDGKCPSA